jgi:kynurenine formamidase
MRDISELTLDEVILDAVVVRVAGAKPGRPIDLVDCDIPEDISGMAVLFQFGWDKYWGTDVYETYPFIGDDVIARVISGGAKLIGMDTFNADDRTNPRRPVHSELLKRNILIVENLRNLEALPDSGFRFFAVPIKAKSAAAMTVRAFAEVQE